MKSDRRSTVPVPFKALLTAIANPERWRILNELMNEALPSGILSRRVGLPQTNVTKHLRQLCRGGVVIRGYGNVYRIPAEFMVSGQRTVDVGPVVLRLDRQPEK